MWESVKIYASQGGEPDPRNSQRVRISKLSAPCLRKVAYEEKFGDLIVPKLESELTKAIGTAVHTIPMIRSAEMEMDIDVAGITGHSDEFLVRDGLLLEKKTCSYTPALPYAHHVRQVRYYWAVLSRLMIAVNQAFIGYINVCRKWIKAFEASIDMDVAVLNDFGESDTYPAQTLSDIWHEMNHRRMIILKSRAFDILPPATIGRHCDYCDFVNFCNKDYFGD